MAARNQQDAFIDDSDESCPLCVEEFDLSDKNFRPCPCGYQICQFCYNNIKNHMNGLCPACRRPYDDQSIEWKIVSPEEQKADIALQARKKAIARKKESEQRQVETLNRKNLAGIRVVQKNLVYVIGLSQKSSEEEFLRTLRGPQYFGQYGKITKIVVSKAKEGQNGSNSIGVYVTFESREDAAKCIAAVDGSQNLDRPLRAQYGTTKYCSAFLRNEACGNRNCTFLHETGEDNDSFSRQDLSSMNALSTQRPAHQASSSRSNQPPQPQVAPQHNPQSISATSQLAPSHPLRDDAMSRSDSGDGSALPSSASWAAKNPQTESSRSSQAASVAAPSPISIHASVPQQPAETRLSPSGAESPAQKTELDSQLQPTINRQNYPKPLHPLESTMKIFMTSSFKFTFDRSIYTDEELREIESYPPLFDDHGGIVRYRMEQRRERERQKQEEERNTQSVMSAVEEDETPASGSLQLGGEPETQDEPKDTSGRISAQQRSAIQPPFGSTSQFTFGGTGFPTHNAANLTRTLTPQQQHQLSLLRSQSSRQSPINTSQFQQGYAGNTSLHHHQQSNPFQMQNPSQVFNTAQGHTRHASRYTFANDTSSASTAVKPAANPQLMAQQSSMMPTAGKKEKTFQNQALHQSSIHSNTFYSGVQGPPPGLKSSGTPPVSGGGMFGQGHGFASAMGGSGGFGGNIRSKNSNEELMRQLLRERNGSINGQGTDAGKREFKFPFAQQSMNSDAPAPSLLSPLYGSQLGAHHGYQDHNLQKQKKKGKKHRHANTSSSGGGGIVDLADPSILQARMHHGAAGQGQFSTHGQDPVQNFHPQDTGQPVRSRLEDTTPTPSALPPPSKTILKPSQTSTLVPPGLSLPQDFPPLAAPSSQSTVPARLQRKATANTAIKPVVPNIGSPSSKTTAATKEPQSKQQANTKMNFADFGDESAGHSDRKGKKDEEQVHDKGPALQADSTRDPSNIDQDLPSSTSTQVTSKQRPEKLDIAAAKDTSKHEEDSEGVSIDTKKAIIEAPGAPSFPQPTTPASASFALRQSLPQMLRLSRNESQPNSPSNLPSAAASRQASRRPSMTSLHRPASATEERLSDNASLTSTSMSRANSPPPTKIGSAPVRAVTKSQQRKDRQARAKLADSAAKVEEVAATVVEEVQAPIVGRKKKTKKGKFRSTAESTPTITRPGSPVLKEEATDETPGTPVAPATPVKDNRKSNARVPTDAKEPNTPSSPATPASGDQQREGPSIAALFAQLQRSGELGDHVADLFKNVNGLNFRYDTLQPLALDGSDCSVTDDQIRQLENNEAIKIQVGPDEFIVILPDHQTLPGLPAAMATRYLELRKKFVANGHVPYNRAVPACTAIKAALAVASARVASKSTRLINPFLTPADLAGAAKTQNYAHAGSGTVNEDSQDKRPILTVAEADQALASLRKETEAMEKKLNALLKRNRRLLFGSTH